MVSRVSGSFSVSLGLWKTGSGTGLVNSNIGTYSTMHNTVPMSTMKTISMTNASTVNLNGEIKWCSMLYEGLVVLRLEQWRTSVHL